MNGSNLPPFPALLVLRAYSSAYCLAKGVPGEEGRLCWFKLVGEQSPTVCRGTEHRRGLSLVTPFLASSTRLPAVRVTHSSVQENTQDEENFVPDSASRDAGAK